MSFLAIIIASAGMSLGLAGPEHANHANHGMDKDTTKSHEPAHECAECATLKAGESCQSCAAHALNGEAKKDLPKVDSALYGNAAWPAQNKGDSLYAKDFQGQALPVAMGNETWISEKTELAGKVIVLDFWATWCPPCRAAMPILDKMQKENMENLAVVAIGGQNEDEKTVREFVAEHKESIINVYDANQSVFKKFESEGIPLVVVMSTDGIIRWIGNPHDPNFQAAVTQVLKVDPLINAKG